MTLKKCCLFVCLALTSSLLSAFEGEYTILLRQKDGTVPKLKTLEYVGTETVGPWTFLTMKAHAPGTEIRKECPETKNWKLYSGHAWNMRFFLSEKPTPEQGAATFREDFPNKANAAFLFEMKMQQGKWTDPDRVRFLRLALECPERPANQPVLRDLLLAADARELLPALEKDASDAVKKALEAYRATPGWRLTLPGDHRKREFVFLCPSTGERQTVKAPATPFLTPDKAEWGKDFCRLPYGNSGYEYRLTNGKWALTFDPVKTPPKELSFGRTESDLSKLSPDSRKLTFVQKSIHPFLAEYEYELIVTHPDGSKENLPLAINTGGRTFINLYRVPADPQGRYGELLIVEGNYGTDILDWKAEKMFLLHRMHKYGRADRVLPAETPLYRRLFLQERRSVHELSGGINFDEHGAIRQSGGNPPVQEVSDWRILSRRVYAGHIGGDGKFQTPETCPCRVPERDYSLDEIDPEKLRQQSLEECWDALQKEEAMIFCRQSDGLECSFTESPYWRLLMRFPRRDRLNFLGSKLTSKKPTRAVMLKQGALTEGAFARIVLDQLGGFPPLTASGAWIAHPENIGTEIVPSPGYANLSDYVKKNQFSVTGIEETHLYCNLPDYTPGRMIRLTLTAWRLEKDGKKVKGEEGVIRFRQRDNRLNSNPSDIVGDLSFDIARPDSGKASLTCKVTSGAVFSEPVQFSLPIRGRGYSWAPPGQTCEQIRAGEEFHLLTLRGQDFIMEIRAVLILEKQENRK